MKDILVILVFLYVNIGSICAQPIMGDRLSANNEQSSIIEMQKDSGEYKVDRIVRKRTFYIIYMSDGEKRIKVLSSKKKPQENMFDMIKLRKGYQYYIKTTSLLYVKNMMRNIGIILVYDNSKIKQNNGVIYFEN